MNATRSALVLLLPAIAGCLGSGLDPVDPGFELDRAAAARVSMSAAPAHQARGLLPAEAWREGPGFLAAMLDRLLAANPDILEAAAFSAAAARKAATGSPWGDPFLQAGPTATPGRGPGAGLSASLSLSLPVGGRTVRESDLLREESRAASSNLAAVAVEKGFELRLAILRVMSSAACLRTAEEGLDWARKGFELAEKALEAGQASALDSQLAKSEEHAARMAALEAKAALEEDRLALASLLALDRKAVPAIPPLAADYKGPAIPDRKAVVSAMISGSPELMRALSAVRVQDRRLALERTRAFPDLEIGVEVEIEPGEPGASVAVPFGLSLPLFDGNAAAKAEARAEALAARESYKASLSRLLCDLEAFEGRAAGLAERLRHMDQRVLPGCTAALGAAEEAMKASGFEALAYVELQRSFRERKLERENIVRELLETAVGMERLAGTPLFRMPGG